MYIRWPRLLTPTYLSQLLRSQKNPRKAVQIFHEAESRYPNYRHNGLVYETMISILGRSGKMADMQRVIDQMKEDSCACRDSVFARTIKTYANAGMLNEAILLFRDIPKFNCVNWTESFNTMLEIFLKERKLEIAHHIFLENSSGWEVKSRIRSLNLLIEALCQTSRSDLALQVFLEMNSQCCYPNKDTYRILMRGLCDERRLDEATHLLYSMFWRISQKGSGEDIVIYRTLLDGLCDNGHVDQALQILGKILRKGLRTPKRCHKQLDLSQLDIGADTETIKISINEVLIKGGIPSVQSYSAMVLDLYSEGKISEANNVVVEMQDRGFKPVPHLIYEAKVAALCSAGRVDEAADVIQREMIAAGDCVPTIAIYNTVIKGLCHLGKSASAVDYLKQISRRIGCVPNEESYTILVNGLCHDDRYAEASEILYDMLIRSYWPSIATFNALIPGLCCVGKPHEAVMWLEEMVSEGKIPERGIWNSLVNSFCSDAIVTDVFSRTLKQLTESL